MRHRNFENNMSNPHVSIKDIIIFYKDCIVLTFSGKFIKAQTIAGVMSLLITCVIFFIPVTDSDERFYLTDFPTRFFLILFLLEIIVGFIYAPFERYTQEKNKRQSIESLRVPKIKISLPDGGVQDIYLGGSTTETISGNRSSVVTNFLLDIVCLKCENIGEVFIRNCRSRIIRGYVYREGATACLDIVESIELSWKKEDMSCLSVDFPPNETRRIWIGGVRSGGQFWVYRPKNALPIEYQSLFGLSGRYILLIQLDSEDMVPIQVVLRVETKEGVPQTKPGIIRGKIKAEIVEISHPRIGDNILEKYKLEEGG